MPSQTPHADSDLQRIYAQRFSTNLEYRKYRETLARLASRFQVESRVRHFLVRKHMNCKFFAQLTWREGLRDIVECLNAKPEALYHLGFREPVAKSTPDGPRPTLGGDSLFRFAPQNSAFLTDRENSIRSFSAIGTGEKDGIRTGIPFASRWSGFGFWSGGAAGCGLRRRRTSGGFL